MEAFISAGDAVVRYSRYGVGERTVLLLHGYGQSMDTFEEFGGQLGKKYRVVTVDLPGSGFSTYGTREVITTDYMAEVVMELITKLGIEKYSVVGHSMGGYVAAALSEKDSERVEKIVMFHSLAVGDSDEKRAKRKQEIELLKAGKKELLAGLNPLKGFAEANKKRCEDDIDEKVEQFLMTDDDALVATLEGLMERPDRTSALKTFAESKPLAFIFGMHDDYIPFKWKEEMEKEIPNAKYYVLENSGHMGYREEKGVSLTMLEVFLG